MKTFVTLAAGIALSLTLGTAAFTQDAPAAAPDTAPVATTAPAPAPETAPAPDAALAPAPAAAPAEKGKIVFFRPWRLTGGAYAYYVVETGDDGKSTKETPRVGKLPNGGAFAVDVEPGVHSYNVTGPMAVNYAEDRIRMDVEPGETYYVEQTVRFGVITGGFRLVPADEARFTTSKVKMEKPAE